jgi:hypothetical protein
VPYRRLAAAAIRPRVDSVGPPVRVGWKTPAAEAAAWPRAASFGPPVWLADTALRLELDELDEERNATATIAAQITSAVTMRIESLLGRTRG